MSKKKNKNEQNKNIVNTKESSTTQETEQLSKGEKIFYRITITVGVLAILLIIILVLTGGGDKESIAKKYNSLTNDNVFKTIKYNELEEKINNKEEFQLLVISNTQQDSNYFIYCVDYMMKSVNEEKGTKGEIYIINPVYLKDDQKTLFKDIDTNILKGPSIIKFEYTDQTIVDHSVDGNSSTRYLLENYENNYFNLLARYFNDCYNEK